MPRRIGCNAQRYERSAARRDTRAGHYQHGLQTKAGEVRLRVPKLRRQAFETAIIERCRERRGVLSRGCPAKMRRALVPQHLQPRALAKMREIAAMLNAIHASEDLAAAREKAIRLIDKLHGLHLSRAAELVETAVEETLT